MNYFDLKYSRFLYSHHMCDSISVDLWICDLCAIVSSLRVLKTSPELADLLESKICSHFDSIAASENNG